MSCAIVRKTVAAFSIVAMGLSMMSFPANAGTTFVVTSAGDNSGTCGSTCTLRQAIQAANATADLDTIHFNILFCGAHTISITGDPLVITHPIIIDATTQPSCGTRAPVDHQSLIEIRGRGTNVFVENPNNSLFNGLFLASGSDGSTIRGLSINGFSGAGIRSESPNNDIVNNKLGTDSTGTIAKPNGVGISTGFRGTSNDISGNVISGNLSDGMVLGAASTAVFENLIGVAADGVTALPNAGDGIRIGTIDSEIGISASLGNTIAFNGANGIEMVGTSHGNEVLGNRIFSNVGSGILLNGNHANNNQAPPVITSIVPTAMTIPGSPPILKIQTVVRGTLANATAGGFHVDLYANDAACDNPSTVEGQAFLITTTVGTDGTFFAALSVDTKSSITAIARSPTGDSSAFSACKASP